MPLPETTDHVQTFEARGKLMLAGEYLVLDGAAALAVPTRLGQRLRVTPTDEADVLQWTSVDRLGRTWLRTGFTRRGLRQAASKSPPKDEPSPEQRLGRLLGGLLDGHRLLWPTGTGLHLETILEFDRSWGLGSSATLAYLLSAWAGADAYAVNEGAFGGSGYDIATAGAEGPLLYRRSGSQRVVHPIRFAPDWLRGASLVHLGRKQDSREGIRRYRAQAPADIERFVGEVDELTVAIARATDVAEATDLLRRHEALIGYVTHQTPLGRERFADFPGIVKSLGAWGGDFALALPEETGADVGAYFAARGLDTVLSVDRHLLLDAALPPLPPAEAAAWPVFFYGELGLPDADREWLGAYPHTAAELLDYGVAGLVPGGAPRPAKGQRTGGMLVYLPPDDVVALDLHPRGVGYRRRHALVEAGGRRVRAQVWLGTAAT